MQQAAQYFGAMSKDVLRYYVDFESRLSAVNEKLTSISSNYTKSLEEKAILFEKLDLILDNLPAGIIIIDNTGIISKNNKQALDIFEISLIDKRWDIIASRYCRTLENSNDVLLNNGRIVSITTMPLQNSSEQIIMITDITRDSNIRSVNNKKASAMALEKLALSIAHQIKTPLSTAMLSLSQVEGKTLDASIKKDLTTAQNKINDIAVLTDELLGIGRGGLSNKEDILVKELYEFLLEYVVVLERKYNIVVNSSYIGAVNSYININKSSFASSVLNVLENALQASSIGRTVGLHLISSKDFLTIKVTDRGCGLEKHLGHDIFSPFVSTKKIGNGLGLSIAKSIVDNHGGKITYQDNKYKGTTFFIKIRAINE